MFLSRCQVNPVSRGGRKLLGSPQAMHAAVMSAFHEGTIDPGRRVLWRVDERRSGAFLYVVSGGEPDFRHIIEQAGWPTTQTWDIRDYDLLLNRLVVGQTWQFRLTANPTHAVRLDPNSRSKRLAHVTVAQQLDWLTSRASQLGVSLTTAKGESTAVVVGRESRTFRRGNGQVTIARATYEGRLVIEDVDALRTALVTGIGRAKAYGCGLLTLAPVHG